MNHDHVEACSVALGVNLHFIPQINTLPVMGRIQFCEVNWCSISRDPWIIGVVKGYHLELVSTPHQRKESYHRQLSSTDQSLVREDVEKLIAKQAVTEVEVIPSQFVSRLFLVPKKDGSKRPVINLKLLNGYIRKQKFKMERA